MVDCLQGRALLLSLTEPSGPRLESGFFVTSDSPGLLVLFWDLSVHLPDSLCFIGGAISVTSSIQTLMAVVCSSAAPTIWRRAPLFLPPASDDVLPCP